MFNVVDADSLLAVYDTRLGRNTRSEENNFFCVKFIVTHS
jgi:hypothetical protein